MSHQYTHLMRLTPNQLHNHVMKLDVPQEHREHIKATVLAQKAAMRSDQAQRTKVRAEWRPLLDGLRMERESLRSMRNYEKKQSVGDTLSPKLVAIEGYIMVLEKLREEFTNHIRSRQTPAVLARERKLPNGGIHWTDWVKDRHKQRVVALFGDIPPKQRTKIKLPFPRTVKAESNDRLRARLKTRTIKEHGIAVQSNQLNPTERSKAKLSKLAEALRRIDNLNPSDPVPRTWSGLFTHEGEEK